MTYKEAVEAMKQGHKLTHQYFTSDEFFIWNGFNIECEGGYDMSEWHRGEDWQDDGWRISQ